MTTGVARPSPVKEPRQVCITQQTCTLIRHWFLPHVNWTDQRKHFTDLSVLVKVLENLIAPVLVLVVLGEPVQVEETLHRLWSQEVVSVCKLSENTEETQTVNYEPHLLFLNLCRIVYCHICRLPAFLL